MVCTLLAGINVVAFAADDELTDTVAVQKFYWNPAMGGSGEHIYTVDEDEIDYYSGLSDWNNEGDAWNAPLMSDNPVYRLCNYNTGEHIWVADKGYADLLVEQGWTIEQGIAFYSADADGVPVYRLWNGTDGVGCHHYTTNEEEIIGMQLAGWKLEDVAFYGVKEEEPSELSIEATQTGSKEVSVEVTEGVVTELDSVVLTRKNNTVDASFVVAEDGKSIVITTDSALADDDYTVTVTSVLDPEVTASDTFTAEASKLESIAFVSDELILTPNAQGAIDYKSGAAAIRGFDQFGEPQLLEDGTVKAYSVYSTGATTEYSKTDGGVVMFSTTGTSIMTVGSQVPVTAIYQSGTTVLQTQATLTVSNAQVVASLEFGELTTDNLAWIGKPITHNALTNGNYYFPVKAMDQYGNQLKAAQLNGMVAGGTLIVSPNTNTSLAYINAVSGQQCNAFETLSDGSTIVRVTNGNVPYPGQATFTAIGVGGTQATTGFTIYDERYISEMELTIPTLYAGQENEIEFTAFDQYGDEFTQEELVDLFDATVAQSGSSITLTDTNALTQGHTTLEVSAGTLNWKENAAKKTVRLTYTPTAAQTTVPATLILTTAQPTVSSFTLTAKADGVAAGIKSTSSKLETTIGGATTSVNLGNATNIVWTDTYGNIITQASKYPNYTANKPTTNNNNGTYYTVTSQNTNPTYTQDAGNGKITSKVNGAGTDNWIITLYEVSTNPATAQKTVTQKDTKTVPVKVSSEKYTAYQVGFANALTESAKTNLYVGARTLPTDNETDQAVLVIYGVDTSGNVVKLNANDVNITGITLRNDSVGEAGLALYDPTGTGAQSVLTVATPSAVAVDEEATGTAYVDVYAKVYSSASDTTGTVKLAATASLDVSDDAPETLMIVGQNAITGQLIDLSEGISMSDANTANEMSLLSKGGANPLTGKTIYGNVLAVVGYVTVGQTPVPVEAYTIMAVDQYGMSHFDKVLADGIAFADGPFTTTKNMSIASDDVSALFTVTP